MKSSGVQIVGVYVGLMYMEVSLRGSSNEVPGHLEEPFFWQAWEDMNEPETGLGARGKWGKDWGCRTEGSNPKYSMGTAWHCLEPRKWRAQAVRARGSISSAMPRYWSCRA